MSKNILDILKNDLHKKELAISNGVDYYVELNCQKSELEWVKKSIMKSVLPKLIGFDKYEINWEQCSTEATKNSIKEICDYYKNNKTSTILLAKKFGFSQQTIIKYLKKGNELKWCVFNPKENMRESAKERSKNKIKTVFQYNLNGKFIRKWSNGLSEIETKLGISKSCIISCCNGRNKSAGGYMWSYIYKEIIGQYKNLSANVVVQCSLDGKFIKLWDSITEAQKSLNISHISDCCRGKCKTNGGYKWMYYNNWITQYIGDDKNEKI